MISLTIMALNRLDGIRVTRLFSSACFGDSAEICGQARRRSGSRENFKMLQETVEHSWR